MSRPAITKLFGFSSVWPEVEARLLRRLHCRGANADTARDIAQEVAARALEHQPGFESADDLYRWAGAVADRIAVDINRFSHRWHGGELEERPSAEDVEAAALARVDLDLVRVAFSSLSTEERRVLRDGAVPGAPRERHRLSMARHRARAHLLRVIDGLGAVLVVGRLALARLRRLWVAPAVAVGIPVSLVVLGYLQVSPATGGPVAASNDGVATRPPMVALATRPSSSSERPPTFRGPSTPARQPMRKAGPSAQSTLPIARQVEVPSAAWHSGEVHSRPAEPGDHTICIRNFPVVGSRCVG